MRENTGQPQSPLNAGGECAVPTDACTVDVSASQRAVPDPNGPRGARYWGASADGSKVFFSSDAELTEDAYTGPADGAANLYEYDLEDGRLTDLTVDRSDANGAAVQGVVQVSEDGSYVYFVAEGALAKGAVAGADNLYVSSDGSAPVFIATLAAGDGVHRESGDETDWGVHGYDNDSSAVSRDGTRLAFVSEQSLTGYDNEPAGSEECTVYGGVNGSKISSRCTEVYLYDASTGSLVCVSCNPDGARPVGPSSLGEQYRPLPEHRRRNFSEDGSRLFFQSADALVPHASDGRLNVYEYEDGRVYPISDVAGAYESFLLDASANGNDVFIATADQLVPQDRDNRVDVYDARVGGGFPALASAPPCDNGDSCKPPPTSQSGVFGAPASATFSGAGNLAPGAAAAPAVKPKARPARCRKGFVKRRGRCVKKPTAKRAKKSIHGKGSK